MFKDRHDAGKRLAKKLLKFKGKKDTIILAIPRGGLEIGYELAKALNLKLDIIVTKKIPYPGQPELAIGAVGMNEEILNAELIKTENISPSYIKEQIKEIIKAAKDKYKRYHKQVPITNLKNKILILTDDGIAMGHTMAAAIIVAKKDKPKKIIVAIPVGSPEAVHMLNQMADEVICLQIPSNFFAIAQFYESFPQLDDTKAIEYLKEANT